MKPLPQATWLPGESRSLTLRNLASGAPGRMISDVTRAPFIPTTTYKLQRRKHSAVTALRNFGSFRD